MLNTEGGQVVEAIRRRKSVTYQSIVNMLYYTGVLAIKNSQGLENPYTRKNGLNQDVSRHCIDLVYPAYSDLSTRRLNESLQLQWTGPSLVNVMACCLCGAKPLPKSMMAYCDLDP